MASDRNHENELRRYRRAIPRFQIRCRILNLGRVFDNVEMMDLSLGGARIQSPERIPEEASVVLELPKAYLGYELALRGQVVWTSPVADSDKWEAGVRFLDSDAYSAERLFEKAASLPASSVTENPPSPEQAQRGSARISQICPVLYRDAFTWFGSWSSGDLIDLSGSGMAFFAGKPLAPETILDVEIQLPGMPQHPRVRGVVVRADSAEGDPQKFRVGLQFIKVSEGDQTLLAEHVAQRLRESLGEI